LCSKEDLAALKNKCLAIPVEVIGSQSLQKGVTRAFAAGNVSFIADDYFLQSLSNYWFCHQQVEKAYPLSMD
jgi:hypothetical protein